MRQTRVGKIWGARAVFALVLLGVTLYLQHVYRVRWHYILCAVVASLPLMIGSLVSHSAADEMSLVSILPYALHILFAGIWFGALPAFLLIIFSKKYSGQSLDLLSINSHRSYRC